MLKTNKAKLSGRLLDEFKVSHTCQELNFFKNKLIVERSSGVEDEIPIIIPETLLYHGAVEGRYAIMEGDIRTYTTKQKHLAIVFFVKKVKYDKYEPCENEIELKGSIYRKGFLREDKYKGLKSDFMVQVKGRYDKTFDIPCVCYGELALKVSDLELKDNVTLLGRFQSRKYFKSGEVKETYEVAVSDL